MCTGNFANKRLFIAALALCLCEAASAREQLSVHTGHWPPFVGHDNTEPGIAADVVRQVLLNMDVEMVLVREGFAFGFFAVGKADAAAAFPYFSTPSRREQVLFSAPLFTVRNTVYYNLQFNDFSNASADPAELRVGRVTGYSYGEQIDEALSPCPATDLKRCPVFASEADAVRALLSDQIDLLPMTDTVAARILDDRFMDEAQLLREVSDTRFSGRSTLHLIAPRSDEGRAFIRSFNASHAELLEAGVIASAAADPAPHRRRGTSVVRISAAEGFPIVVGVAADDDGTFYAVPEGTRALVLEWSDKIASPARDDRLYAVMVDQSLVVVLDGPHVGKELRIRNMHLAIDE
ncbi:MAG: transporter substrate-binding domain-containing protein [Pseudomonadota bacterium]